MSFEGHLHFSEPGPPRARPAWAGARRSARSRTPSPARARAGPACGDGGGGGPPRGSLAFGRCPEPPRHHSPSPGLCVRPFPTDSCWKTGFRPETESCFSVGGSLTFGPSVLDKRPSDLLDFFFFKIVLEEMVEAY